MAILAITGSDGTAIAGGPIRKLWVGVSGAVAVIDVQGNTATLAAVPAGQWVVLSTPVAFVKATGTTATGIVADTQV